MRLFGISSAGLVATAAAVLTLWGCLAFEQRLRREAVLDLQTSRRTLDRLRERALPAARPGLPWRPRRALLG